MSEFKKGDRVIVRGVVTGAGRQYTEVEVARGGKSLFAPEDLEPEPPYIPKKGDRVVTDDGTSGVVTGLWVDFEDAGCEYGYPLREVHPVPAVLPGSAPDLLAAARKALQLLHLVAANAHTGVTAETLAELRRAIGAYEEANP